MSVPLPALAAAFAAGLLASPAAAQSVGPATPYIPLTNEPPPKLVVDQPIAEKLAAGAVFVPYRTENFRILPAFGPGALDVSPRVGHLHVTLDDLPWHWADASDNQTVVVVGLPPGPHKLRLELADPTHKVIEGQTVAFTIPDTAAHRH